MTWTLKSGTEGRVRNAALGLQSCFLAVFDSLLQHKLVGSSTRALLEQLGKVVRAQAGNRRQLRQANILL